MIGPDNANARTPEELFRTGGAAAWLGQADAAFWQQQIGQRLGPYLLEALIGEGGMSVVFRGRRADGAFEREVAIKFLRQSRDAERLLDEARAVANLNHPGIVDLIDAGRWNEIPYLVLELIDGLPLDRHIDVHGADLEQRLDLWLACADAVAYAHSRFLAHRDIKPGNILIDQSGRPRLVDFGISRGFAEAGDVPATLAGTPYYMAPELAVEQSTDARPAPRDYAAADQYALALLLAELLMDRRLRQQRGDGLSPPAPLPVAWAALAAQEQSDLATALGTSRRRLQARLCGDLSVLLAKAVADDPAKRYASVAELAADLRRWRAGECIVGAPAGPWKRLRKGLWRRRRAVGLALAVASLLGVQLTATVLRLNQERERALQAEADARGSSRFLIDLLASVDPLQGALEKLTPKELFARAIERADDLPENSTARGEILLALAELGIGLSELERAEELLQRAQASFAAAAGLDTGVEARLASQMARLNYYRGQTQDAYENALRAWTLMRALRGEDDRESFEMALSAATLNPDRSAGAIALAAALQSPHLDPELSPETRSRRVGILINLAYARDAVGSFDPALSAIDEALSLINEYSPSHLLPAVLSSRAYIQFHRGELDLARDDEGRALALKRELFAPAHLSIFSSLDTLARIEAAADDMSALLATAEQALAELKQTEVDQFIHDGKQRVWGGRAALAELRMGRPDLALERLGRIEAAYPDDRDDAFNAVCAHIYAQADQSGPAARCLQRWRAAPDRPEWVLEEVRDFSLQLPAD